MPLRDELLTPIPGTNPGGAELRYDPLYDKIIRTSKRVKAHDGAYAMRP